jgi:EmrB/QacA subfamily drug resistance transporter
MTQKGWTLVAAVLGSGIVFLDSTIVNVALPKIGAELPATLIGTLEGQTYVTSGYLATLAALLILAGALSDFYGRRRIFVIGLAGFGASSLLCGLSPNLELLVLFRILQGATGALLVPGSLALITAAYPGEERAKAIGMWAAATSAVTVLGPALGGFLVDTISWRAAFLINVPLVAIALFATIRYVRESRDESSTGQFDWLGAVVGAVAVGGLAFGGIRGQSTGWNDAVAYIALAVGAVATALFLPLMARRPHPLVPLGLFRSRNFAVANLSTFLVYGALYVTFGFQGLYLQNTLGYSAMAAGLAGIPVGLFLTFLSTKAGALAGRIGVRPFMTAGPLVMAAGLLWFARIPATSRPWEARLDTPATLVPSDGYFIDVLPGILLFALGISLLVAPLTATVMTSIPLRNSGLASAINNAISRVGAPLISAVIFIAITSSFYTGLATRVPGLDASSAEVHKQIQPLNIPKTPPAGLDPQLVATAARDASTDAFHLAMLVSAALLIAGGIVNAVGIRKEERPQDETGASTEAVPAA